MKKKCLVFLYRKSYQLELEVCLSDLELLMRLSKKIFIRLWKGESVCVCVCVYRWYVCIDICVSSQRQKGMEIERTSVGVQLDLCWKEVLKGVLPIVMNDVKRQSSEGQRGGSSVRQKTGDEGQVKWEEKGFYRRNIKI